MITDIIGSNFLSYREQFHLRINQGQLNVVIGSSTSDYADSNGTGKTSLLKALLWCLYGKFPGMEDADSVINKSAKKDTEVTVHFQKQGTAYVIQRYRKHHEHRNNLICWEGTHAHAGDLKIVQAKLVEILGMDYDVFLSTLTFTGEREDEFASGTDKDQKKVLNALLPLHFEHARDFAAMEYAKANEVVTKAQTTIGVLEKQLPDFDERKRSSEQQATEWVRNRSASIHDAEASIKSYKEADDTLKGQLQTAEENEAQWQKVFAEIRQGQPALTAEHQVKALAVNEARSKIAAADSALSQQNRLYDEIKKSAKDSTEKQRKLDEQIQAVGASDDQRCPTCNQSVQGEALSRTLAALREQSQQLSEAHDALVTDRQQRSDALKTELLDDRSAVELQINVDLARIKEIDDMVAGMALAESQHTEAYQQHSNVYTSVRTKIENSMRDLARFEQQLKDLQANDTNPYQGQVDQIAEQRAVAEKELKETRQAQTDAEVGMRRWAVVKTMFSGGKGGLHHFVFEQVLPEMTAMAQMFLNFFSANTLKVAFESHKKKGKKVIEGFFVHASKGAVIGFGNLSRGEQRRINVAISLTLYLMACKHVFNPGILFLDEVADSLDQTGKQSIIELLEHFCSQYDTAAVLLTNERELIAHVHSGYECVMDQGVSTLVPISES